MVDVFCTYCGNMMQKKAAYVRRREREGRANFYCDKKCQNAAHSKRMSGKGNPNFEGTFYGECPSEWSEEKRVQATSKMRETVLREGTNRGSRNGRYKGELKTYECEMCGKETPPKSHYVSKMISEGKQKPFCSEGCTLLYAQKAARDARRRGMTSIERKVADALERYGIEYEHEFPIGIYYADFYLIDHGVIIECDGDYWHSKPEVVERDSRKNAFYELHGICFHRFTETDINERFEVINDKIREYATASKRKG